MSEKKKEPITGSVIQRMIEQGLPVTRAEFHAAVNNGDNIPENYFSNKSNVKSRNVQMWWINGNGILCLHHDKYFLVPAASVKFCNFE
jgi:hypothetical protein